MANFKIEHYPNTGRFYPTYNGKYLKKEYCTGIVRTETLFDICDYGETEKEALEIIKEFKEQQLKEGVKIINVE